MWKLDVSLRCPSSSRKDNVIVFIQFYLWLRSDIMSYEIVDMNSFCRNSELYFIDNIFWRDISLIPYDSFYFYFFVFVLNFLFYSSFIYYCSLYPQLINVRLSCWNKRLLYFTLLYFTPWSRIMNNQFLLCVIHRFANTKAGFLVFVPTYEPYI